MSPSWGNRPAIKASSTHRSSAPLSRSAVSRMRLVAAMPHICDVLHHHATHIGSFARIQDRPTATPTSASRTMLDD
eukprot:7540733-Pyramimonas_sp.AAC.1